ncbi:MAG: hypothetical protein EXS25_11890 [Pedosphaera sp.]|nr:hypothetical protein [Pedosphaera sp.]
MTLSKSYWTQYFRSDFWAAWIRAGGLVFAALFGLATQANVVDDFNDNSKTSWTDFTFVPGFGLPTESDGKFKFIQPPAGQSIFSASQKTSERFELKEGRSIEFRVDVIEGGGKDSFAVLAFIPTGNSPGTLAGYGLAKSTTDVLITKAVGKYFVAENGPAKQNNITLVQNLTVKNGSVIIHSSILDKDANNAVIWERTVVDTAAADVLSDGKDDPAAPFITAGYFTLYLYQDFDPASPETPYQVAYDNAETFVTDAMVLDDFNDNAKTGWTDFTFLPGFGLPTEINGRFQFGQPPAGQAIFSASQKTTRVFTLAEGERISFSADIVEGGGKDSFAVLAFIPTGNSPGTLTGYGLAKSTTDVLITKSIGKYFVAENGPAKQENITLNLSLTVRNGAVIISARVLDKDTNDSVIWERTVVDTAGADVLSDGKDDPAAPFITAGYFTLYLYQNFDPTSPETLYKAHFDNALAAAPPIVANVAPILTDFNPSKFANFLPASTVVSFKISDDAPLESARLAITLNGIRYTTTNGLMVTGSGNSKVVSMGGLQVNKNYNVVFEATDAGNLSTKERLDFDTFSANLLTIESEDYNFSGEFIKTPLLIAEGGGPQGDSYANQVGVQDIDFNETRAAPRPQEALWRTQDAVRMERTLDTIRTKYTMAGGSTAGIYDYAVGDIAAGEWLNYTRTIPAGSYEVYLRQSLINMDAGESILEEVTSNPTQPNQITRVLGSFLATFSGFNFRNTPLTDGAGVNKVVLRLDGLTTLRLRQVTADIDSQQRRQNYIILVPVIDAGVQRATVSSLIPASNASAQTVEPMVSAVIQNRDTRVDIGTIKMLLNGISVTPIVRAIDSGVTVSYLMPVLPAVGAIQTARMIFADNQGVAQTNEWSFSFRYLMLDPATRLTTPGSQRGLIVHVVQPPVGGSNLENNLARAEAQLATGSTIPRAYDLTVLASKINYSQDGLNGGAAGDFTDDEAVPGQTEEGGTDNWALEATTFLDLPKGVVRFGVISDDGYKIATGVAPNGGTPALAFHNGGPANEVFDVVVTEAGIYGFRLVWYESGGGAHVEWFTVNTATGVRTLVNAEGGIRAYTTAVMTTPLQLTGSATLSGAYGVIAGASVNAAAKTVTTDLSVDTQFFKLSSGSVLTLTGIQISGGKVVISYR